MARCSALAVLVLAAVLVAASWRVGEAAMSCGQVINALRPCLAFATGAGPLTNSCCSGVSSVNNAASTPEDRRSTCTCLKSTASGIGGLKGNALGSIPTQCHVKIPFAISTSTDCSKVN